MNKFAGLEQAFNEIAEWQAEQFPDATPEGVADHLLDELMEWIALDKWDWGCPDETRDYTQYFDNLEELADVLHMIIAYAVIRNIDIVGALRYKLAINKARVWPGKATNGRYDHVE